MSNKINIKEKFLKFSEHWSPKVIAELNDYQFKLAKIKGEFIWHKHDETDEVFIIIEGKMIIEFRDKKVELMEGDMYVVPKGVDHRPYSKNECKIMLVEPKGVVNTGNSISELTQDNDVWI
jgi:mannose-6-phosphate isomerase-like protein (cupin superfamily)